MFILNIPASMKMDYLKNGIFENLKKKLQLNLKIMPNKGPSDHLTQSNEMLVGNLDKKLSY